MSRHRRALPLTRAMPRIGRPLPPGATTRRRAVPLRLSEPEEAPVQAIADVEHGGNLSEAIRALLAEALAARATGEAHDAPNR